MQFDVSCSCTIFNVVAKVLVFLACILEVLVLNRGRKALYAD